MIAYRKEIEALNPYVPGRPIDDVKKEYNLEKVVKIASNENPYGCSPNAKREIVNSFANTSLYPDGNCTLLKEKIAEKYLINKDEIILGCGTDEVISMISKVFVDIDDECITAETTFSQYAASVISMGGKIVYTPMKDYAYDLDMILNKINSKTKIIFFG